MIGILHQPAAVHLGKANAAFRDAKGMFSAGAHFVFVAVFALSLCAQRVMLVAFRVGKILRPRRDDLRDAASNAGRAGHARVKTA